MKVPTHEIQDKVRAVGMPTLYPPSHHEYLRNPEIGSLGLDKVEAMVPEHDEVYAHEDG